MVTITTVAKKSGGFIISYKQVSIISLFTTTVSKILMEMYRNKRGEKFKSHLGYK